MHISRRIGAWRRADHLCLRHRISILHRDIKLDGLLLAADGCLKIADFGYLGWSIDVSEHVRRLAGTFEIMAPEVLAGRGVQTPANDVWSSDVAKFQLFEWTLFLAE